MKISAKVQLCNFEHEIWKWLKILNSVPFIKKTFVTHVYIRIRSPWLTFRVLQWTKTNFKISQFWRFLLRSDMRFWTKFENDQNFLILLNSSRRHMQIMFTFEFDYFDWFSQLYSEWRQTSYLVNFQVFC